jgi:hypothetical protein
MGALSDEELRRLLGGQLGEGDAAPAQKLGAASAFYSCVPAGMHGPACVFWANVM